MHESMLYKINEILIMRQDSSDIESEVDTTDNFDIGGL